MSCFGQLCRSLGFVPYFVPAKPRHRIRTGCQTRKNLHSSRAGSYLKPRGRTQSVSGLFLGKNWHLSSLRVKHWGYEAMPKSKQTQHTRCGAWHGRGCLPKVSTLSVEPPMHHVDALHNNKNRFPNTAEKGSVRNSFQMASRAKMCVVLAAQTPKKSPRVACCLFSTFGITLGIFSCPQTAKT
eukprot:4569023-Amphidinium_carterae.1